MFKEIIPRQISPNALFSSSSYSICNVLISFIHDSISSFLQKETWILLLPGIYIAIIAL